jgi:AcrR family transcriptional regulator
MTTSLRQAEAGTEAAGLSARARRSERRREELLDAAATLFRDKGVAATTVSEITDLAGVAKGTFYLYFDSKDHVVAGLHERLIDGMHALVVDGYEQLDTDEYWNVLDWVIGAITDFWIAHRETFAAICRWGQAGELLEIEEAKDERMIALFDAGIRVGMERGMVAVDDPLEAARYLFHGCRGATIHALITPGEIDRDRLVANSCQIIRKALSPER